MDDQDNNKDEELVVEGDIVSSSRSDSTNSEATVLLSLEELIKSHIATIDKLREEMRKHNEMFADSFNNSPVYLEHDKKVKEANKVKSATRDQIMKQPAVVQLADKVKSMRLELREKQAALSDYLLEYQRMTGANEIDGPDGEPRDIINSSKVVKRTAKK